MSHRLKLKDTSLLIETGFIRGQPARALSGVAPFEVEDPATGEVWAHAENMGVADTDAAIQAATNAFQPWSLVSARTRARLILRVDRLFREARSDLAQILTLETGKPLAEAEGEFDYAASYTWLMAGECERLQGETIKHNENPNMKFLVEHRPLGPVALLCPWNFPLIVAVRKIVTALAAGCTCVVKPSPETPITASAFALICQRAGIPDGAINVVTASTETTPSVGKKLCEDPRIKKISFTGSTAVGKLLAAQCSTTLKRLTLELGGNGGWIVFDDADLEKASDALIANRFRATGQVCVSANRIFVQRSAVDEFVALMKAKIEKLRLGHGMDPEVTLGPLGTRRGVERCVSLMAEAMRNGGKVITGGERKGNTLFFEPTLVIGASLESRLYKEEIFSPICSIYPFTTDEKVIALCNDTPMGLTNHVWTNNLGRALRASDKLQSGTVSVNTANSNCAEVPYGGIQESGMGKEGGLGWGVREFCYVKSTALNMA